MKMADKTHWKKIVSDPNYLGEADFNEGEEKVAGSPYFEDWPGVKIQLYIEHGIKAFGDVVSAVRVRPRKPQIRNPILCEDCGQEIQGANGRSAEYIAAYTKKKFKGVCLCFACASARNEKPEQEQGGEVNGQTEIDG